MTSPLAVFVTLVQIQISIERFFYKEANLNNSFKKAKILPPEKLPYLSFFKQSF